MIHWNLTLTSSHPLSPRQYDRLIEQDADLDRQRASRAMGMTLPHYVGGQLSALSISRSKLT